MVVFAVSIDGVPMCSARTLSGALDAMGWLPKGLMRITFEVAGERVELSRYNYLADRGFGLSGVR